MCFAVELAFESVWRVDFTLFGFSVIFSGLSVEFWKYAASASVAAGDGSAGAGAGRMNFATTPNHFA